MVTVAMIAELRGMLGESFGPGETEADTLFTDTAIRLLLENSSENIEQAAYEGWRTKAGHLAGLVNVTEGAASREMSTLYTNALEMAKFYSKASTGPTEGRARIGRIRRPWTT